MALDNQLCDTDRYSERQLCDTDRYSERQLCDTDRYSERQLCDTDRYSERQLCDTDRYSERQLMADRMFDYFLPNFVMTNSLKCQCVWFACFTLNIAVGEKRWTCFHLRELSCLQTPTPDLTSKKLF